MAKDPGTARGGNGKGPVINKKEQRRAAAEARERAKSLRDSAAKAEAELKRHTQSLSALDQAMFDPATAQPALAGLAMSELMKRRAELAQQIGTAEAIWLEACEALEGANA